MVAFPKPQTSYRHELEAELAAVRSHKRVRKIPSRTWGCAASAGEVKVMPEVTFKPTGGDANTQTKKVKLIKRP